MKRRFKKALFAFFKDEILNSVSPNPNCALGEIEYTTSGIDFKKISCEIQVKADHPGAYEYELQEARFKLTEEALKHVKVDRDSVFDPYISGTRRIKCSLFIGV